MHQTTEQLFDALVSLPIEAREAALSSANCDDATREEVVRLLRAHETSPQLLNDCILTDLFANDRQLANSVRTRFQPRTTTLLSEGRQLGNYKIVREIGRGGMSVVYRARQHSPFPRDAAIKIIHPNLISSNALIRFQIEQDVLSTIRHRNIAELYDTGSTEDGSAYSAMEFINGVAINSFCQQHQLSVHHRVRIFRQLCSALTHVHNHDVIHRDVKPSNVLVCIENGNAIVKLIDFGVAKMSMSSVQTRRNLTMSGQIIGSPRYMSPEQLLGREADEQSDIFAAGLVLFELLTGEPYRRRDDSLDAASLSRPPESTMQRLTAALGHRNSAKANQARQLRQQISNDLEAIVKKALDPMPSRRFKTMAEFSQAVDQYLKRPYRVGSGLLPQALALPSREKLKRAVLIASLLVSACAATWQLSALVASRQIGPVTIENRFVNGEDADASSQRNFDPASIGTLSVSQMGD